MIIGLSGKSGAGKDEVGKILVGRGFKRLAFADKLREFIYALDPLLGDEFRLAKVIDAYGWDGYKTTSHAPEIRRLLQKLGTEAGRGILSEDIWIDALFSDLADQGNVNNFVITDCRFINEASKIRASGGEVWRINRRGCDGYNSHVSESALDDYLFDVVIGNNGSRDDLSKKVVWLL